MARASFRDYFTDLNVFPGVQSQAIRNALPQVLIARLNTAVTYNNTATLAAINDLALTVEDGKHYTLDACFYLSIGTAADNIQFDLGGGTATATSIIGHYEFYLTAVAPTSAAIAALTTDIDGVTTNAWTMLRLSASLRVNAGGLLIPRGSQQNTGATDSTVLAGSWIRLIG